MGRIIIIQQPNKMGSEDFKEVNKVFSVDLSTQHGTPSFTQYGTPSSSPSYTQYGTSSSSPYTNIKISPHEFLSDLYGNEEYLFPHSIVRSEKIYEIYEFPNTKTVFGKIYNNMCNSFGRRKICCIDHNYFWDMCDFEIAVEKNCIGNLYVTFERGLAYAFSTNMDDEIRNLVNLMNKTKMLKFKALDKGRLEIENLIEEFKEESKLSITTKLDYDYNLYGKNATEEHIMAFRLRFGQYL